MVTRCSEQHVRVAESLEGIQDALYPVSMMRNEKALETEGTVTEALPNAMFGVQLTDGSRVVAHVSSKLRMGFARLLPGDRVCVELSPYDLGRGRITGRSK